MIEVKKILSIAALTLVLTGCTNHAEEKNESAVVTGKKSENKVMNFYQSLKNEGTIAFLIQDREIKKEAQINAVIVNDKGKMKVYKTGLEDDKMLSLADVEQLSDREIIKEAARLDREILEKSIRQAQQESKKYYSESGKSKYIYKDAQELKYTEPKLREIELKKQEEIGHPSYMTINAKPRDLKQVADDVRQGLMVYKIIDNDDKGYTLTDESDIRVTGLKRYAGYKTEERESTKEAGMLIIKTDVKIDEVKTGL